MKLDIKGEEEIKASQQQLWDALNDPEVLSLCMPGCKSMTQIDDANFAIDLQLKVGAVGGSFGGEISLLDKEEPNRYRILVSGGGTLGTGSGNAVFSITPKDDGSCLLSFEGEGEVGGLVAGVGQRILGSVSKHLIKTFFKELRKYFAEPVEKKGFFSKWGKGKDKTQSKLVTLPSGHRLNVVADSSGEGIPVVYLNSLAADHSMWSGVQEKLTARPSLCFDARGHGGSDVVPGDCDVADLGKDALALMDEQGIDRAVLCGLSLGGITAMWIASHAPERVAGLVLANTAVNFPPASMWQERAVAVQADGLDSLVDPTLQRWLTEDYRKVNADSAAAVRTMIAATSAEGYASCCAALAKADLGNELSGFAGPVLLISGQYDESTPLARANEMQALSSQAELVVLEAAHLSSVEQAGPFASNLNAFLKRIDADDNNGKHDGL